MATRNQRKRRAKAKREALALAVEKALALEAARQQAKREAMATTLDTHPLDTFSSSHQKVTEREGKVQSAKGKRKFAAKDAPMFGPLKGNGHDGRGELRKRYVS